MSRGAILFVDDEPELRESAGEWLTVSDFDVCLAADAGEALGLLSAERFDALVTDVRMPGMDGLALLDAIRRTDIRLPVILLTGHGDVPLAVDAMRRGAHDFLEKPYDADHLVAVLDRAVAERRLHGELERLRKTSDTTSDLETRLVGSAASIALIRERIRQLADVNVDVLIMGETGTGKEVVARALHDTGRRRARPFVALNCAAIPESVFEAELFGHERGAFTGAVQARTGRIAHADGGTVFLDEIESMPPALQAKLLRVIQERIVEPIGSNRQMPVDVRFIAATKVDLKAESEAGGFRSDLYFRLSTVTLAIPPLRERREDIALLFVHLCNEAAKRHSLEPPAVPANLLAALGTAAWTGNVRELKAAAERCVLGLPLDIGPQDGTGAAELNGQASLPQQVAAFEAAVIRQALDAHADNVQAASAALGIPRRTLSEKIARLGLRNGDRDGTP
ncbi:sigma-54-dependent transcriptional regulator [Mesorhizobium xinjiangense]|uniref:sigma-54-dependent transcriptional regulator n=1 Tax=Mesorhizobium xinjiangense TaxID=2678685 RepID=UPI0012ED44AF|nr:sigma-54 dependent transcriptional regulator [Mesorhizobium xinjiangense]